MRGWYNQLAGVDVGSHFVQAREQAQMALRIDGTLAEPWAALGGVNFNEWKFAEAEQAFQHALRLNPNYSYAHQWRGQLLMARGRIDEAVAELDRATKLDPLSLSALAIYPFYLQYAGRYAEALEMGNRALALAPTFVPVDASRAISLNKLDRRDEALAAARMAARDVTLKPRWWTDALVVFVFRAAGQAQEAEAYAANIMARMEPSNRARAAMLVALGNTDGALDHLAQIHPGTGAIGLFYYSEACENVRQHPRFPAVLAKLGCTEEYNTARAIVARMQRTRAAGK